MDFDQDQQLDQTVHSLTDFIESGQDDQFMNRFTQLHDFEMGQVYAALPENIRGVAWRIMDDETLATVFDNLEIDQEDIVRLLAEMPPQRGANVLQKMFADNEADLMQAMNQRTVATYLSLMTKDEAQKIRRLIRYEDQTAGALMATEYLAVHQGATIEDVLGQVKKQAEDAESITYVYVVDDGHRLIGVASLRDLLIHPDDMTVDQITNTRVVSVKAGDDQRDVAQVVADYNFFSIPVTDDDGRLLGIVTVDDIVDVIDEEAREEYSGLAAVDVSDTDDSAWHSAVKRIPWLLSLLLLGLVTTFSVNAFESTIRQAPILAAFIPIIAGTAGNAGTQSLALAIRHFGTGSEKSGWKNLVSELISAAILAVVAGFVLGLIVMFWQGNDQLALTIALSIAIGIWLAALIAHAIPALFNKLNFDPAVINGPLVTTVCDWAALLVYFGLAAMMLDAFVGK
ncbi:magnesium transporter [Leuconostocaceae bacterium ESL0958]|nr:magnesium transporter [Leuconostocaceae bacterium ESL0958]